MASKLAVKAAVRFSRKQPNSPSVNSQKKIQSEDVNHDNSPKNVSLKLSGVSDPDTSNPSKKQKSVEILESSDESRTVKQMGDNICASCGWSITLAESYTCKSCTGISSLCTNCTVSHIRKNHVVLNSEKKQPDICPTHKCITGSFCSTCQIVLCLQCFPQHTSHDVRPFDSYEALMLKDELMLQVEKLEDLQKPLVKAQSALENVLQLQKPVLEKFNTDFELKKVEVLEFISGLQAEYRVEHEQWSADKEKDVESLESLLSEVNSHTKLLRDAFHASTGSMVRAQSSPDTARLVDECIPFTSRETFWQESSLRITASGDQSTPSAEFKEVMIPAIFQYFTQLTSIVKKDLEIYDLWKVSNAEISSFALHGQQFYMCSDLSKNLHEFDLHSGRLIRTISLNGVPESFTILPSCVLFKVNTAFYCLYQPWSSTEPVKIGPKILNTQVVMTSFGEKVIFVTKNKNLTVTDSDFSKQESKKKIESSSKKALPVICASSSYIALCYSDTGKVHILDYILKEKSLSYEGYDVGEITCIAFVGDYFVVYDSTSFVVFEFSQDGYVWKYKSRVSTGTEHAVLSMFYSSHMNGLIVVCADNNVRLVPKERLLGEG